MSRMNQPKEVEDKAEKALAVRLLELEAKIERLQEQVCYLLKEMKGSRHQSKLGSNVDEAQDESICANGKRETSNKRRSGGSWINIPELLHQLFGMIEQLCEHSYHNEKDANTLKLQKQVQKLVEDVEAIKCSLVSKMEMKRLVGGIDHLKKESQKTEKPKELKHKLEEMQKKLEQLKEKVKGAPKKTALREECQEKPTPEQDDSELADVEADGSELGSTELEGSIEKIDTSENASQDVLELDKNTDNTSQGATQRMEGGWGTYPVAAAITGGRRRADMQQDYKEAESALEEIDKNLGLPSYQMGAIMRETITRQDVLGNSKKAQVRHELRSGAGACYNLCSERINTQKRSSSLMPNNQSIACGNAAKLEGRRSSSLSNMSRSLRRNVKKCLQRNTCNCCHGAAPRQSMERTSVRFLDEKEYMRYGLIPAGQSRRNSCFLPAENQCNGCSCQNRARSCFGNQNTCQCQQDNACYQSFSNCMQCNCANNCCSRCEPEERSPCSAGFYGGERKDYRKLCEQVISCEKRCEWERLRKKLMQRGLSKGELMHNMEELKRTTESILEERLKMKRSKAAQAAKAKKCKATYLQEAKRLEAPSTTSLVEVLYAVENISTLETGKEIQDQAVQVNLAAEADSNMATMPVQADLASSESFSNSDADAGRSCSLRSSMRNESIDTRMSRNTAITRESQTTNRYSLESEISGQRLSNSVETKCTCMQAERSTITARESDEASEVLQIKRYSEQGVETQSNGGTKSIAIQTDPMCKQQPECMPATAEAQTQECTAVSWTSALCNFGNTCLAKFVPDEDLCSCSDSSLNPVITHNLCGTLFEMIGNYDAEMLTVTIFCHPDNLHQVSITLQETDESIGCFYATDEAVKEAQMDGVFKQFVTFYIVNAQSVDSLLRNN